jgi:hypothetical protein
LYTRFEEWVEGVLPPGATGRFRGIIPDWQADCMDDRITIIEGPPPIFEPVQDGWALSLGEGPHLPLTVLTRLRSFNGPALVERCYRRWKVNQPIHLHYRNDLGLEETAPIVAARSVSTEDGQVLLLWISLDIQKVHIELDSGDEDPPPGR